MFDQRTENQTAESNETCMPAWQRLHSEMKSATRRRSAWDAEHARHLREAEAMQLWHHFGYVSILEYLEREHGIELRTAAYRLRVSHALAELPLLEAELEDGTLQYSHVKELTRVVTPDTEEDWIAAAKGKTCGEVQAMVAGHKPGDGPDDPADPDLRLRTLLLKLPPQVLAMYRQQLAAIEAELGHRLEEADAFRIMMERVRLSRGGEHAGADLDLFALQARMAGWRRVSWRAGSRTDCLRAVRRRAPGLRRWRADAQAVDTVRAQAPANPCASPSPVCGAGMSEREEPRHSPHRSSRERWRA